jgi:hypothetical protein
MINNHLHFSGDLERKRCIGHNKSGQRCKRYVCIGLPYCFTHSLEHFQLKIRPSTIAHAGKGLFACSNNKNARANAVIFLPNRVICQYTGQVITRDELENRYGDYTGPYAVQLQINNGTVIDSALSRGIASLANHKDRDDANAELAITGQRCNSYCVIESYKTNS